MVNDLGIKHRRVGSVTVLDTDSALRIALKFGRRGVPLEKAVQSLLGSGQRQILLNLGSVSSIDAKGLGELVSLYVEVTKEGGQFKLFNLTPTIRQLLIVTNLSAVFASYATEGHAIESFAHDAPSI